GHAGEARPLLERALAIAEGVHGAEHHQVATILANLASVLQDPGWVEEACTREVARIREAWRAAKVSSGEYDDATLSILCGDSNVAMQDTRLFKDLTRKQAESARPLLERSLAIEEKIYGPHHPRVAARLSDLGWVLHLIDRSAEALPLLKRALGIAK